MRWTALLLGAVLAVGLFWTAGEAHRRNCLNQDRQGCSILPWQSGHNPTSTGAGKLPYGVSQAELDKLSGRTP